MVLVGSTREKDITLVPRYIVHLPWYSEPLLYVGIALLCHSEHRRSVGTVEGA